MLVLEKRNDHDKPGKAENFVLGWYSQLQAWETKLERVK